MIVVFLIFWILILLWRCLWLKCFHSIVVTLKETTENLGDTVAGGPQWKKKPPVRTFLRRCGKQYSLKERRMKTVDVLMLSWAHHFISFCLPLQRHRTGPNKNYPLGLLSNLSAELNVSRRSTASGSHTVGIQERRAAVSSTERSLSAGSDPEDTTQQACQTAHMH